MQEVVYYGDGALWVTDQRVVVGEKTYWPSDIRSVETNIVRSDRGAWREIPISRIVGDYEIPLFSLIGAVLVTLVAAPIAWLFARSRRKPQSIYTVRLHTKRGWVTAFASLDIDYTQRIAELTRRMLQSHHPHVSLDQAASISEDAHSWADSKDVDDAPNREYYADRNIRVTDQKIEIGKKAYPLPDVASAEMKVVRPDQFWWAGHIPFILMYLALGALIFSVFDTVGYINVNLSTDLNTGLLVPILLLAFCGAGFALTILAIDKAEYIYILTLSGKFGPVDALASLNPEHIRADLEAVRTAISAQSEQLNTVQPALR